MCFTGSEKKELGEPFNGYTFISFPTLIPTAVSPQLSEFVMERRPLAIYSARGKTLFAKKETCTFFHADKDTKAHTNLERVAGFTSLCSGALDRKNGDGNAKIRKI